MKEGRSSWTAQSVALVRALESIRPDSVRLFDDPISVSFLDPWFRAPFWNSAGARMLQYFSAAGPGSNMYYAVTARTRYIDDHLLQFVNKGGLQLVILGAGFDARPYRFEKLLSGVRVFEVDFPATQQSKIRRLEKAIGNPSDNVTYVPVDFEYEDLNKRLVEIGYDPSRKTCFIWEGVTMYLTPGAVDETLAFVAGNSPPGSSIVFTYSRKSKSAGKLLEGVSRLEHKFLEIVGEPQIFGIEENNLEAFLRERGFNLIEGLSGEQLIDKYISSRRFKSRAARGAIALASVSERRGAS
ncbi:MAG: SAM-dependent methyltransferase [Actinobacteria bacterium]|nr:SAM-dependent methyltransferase [Actinomycetota bacterium]